MTPRERRERFRQSIEICRGLSASGEKFLNKDPDGIWRWGPFVLTWASARVFWLVSSVPHNPGTKAHTKAANELIWPKKYIRPYRQRRSKK